MSSPIPPVQIVGGCSVISNDTLYVYSPDAFQALPLKSDGNWTQLTNGVSVTGAACVKAYTNGTESLWVVGGANNASNPNYPGLQTFSFATQSWATITPQTKVTQNRQNHAAVFLNNSASILVYAGSQDDATVASTQTFLISTSSPYSIQSYTCENYPALNPLLLAWNNNSAITLGGDDGVKMIYHFRPDDGWDELGTSLAFSSNSTQQQQGLLVLGSDNSKVLELYDLDTSPNTVSRIVLQDANGQLAAVGETVGAAASRKRKRQTLSDWPTYNAGNAPTTTRTGYSLAQGSNGLVAISGGNAQQPVELFDQTTNAWMNTTAFFGSSAAAVTASPSASTSSSASSSASATSSSTASPAAVSSTSNGHSRTSLILGATLGSILGFIALLIILLLCLRWRRKKRRTASRESSGSDEKGRLSFADRGIGEPGAITPNLETAGAFVVPDDAVRSSSRTRTITSQSSNAPLVPEARRTAGLNLSPVKEKPSPKKPGGLFARGERNIPSVIIETDSNRNSQTSQQAAQAANHRGSGWSGYFLGKDAPQNRASGMTPRNSTYEPNLQVPKGGTYLNYDPIKPSGSSNHDCRTHGPTEIPPLAMGQEWDTGRVSKVVTAASSTADLPARAPSARSGVTRPSTDAPSSRNDSIFTSPQEHSTWTPVTPHVFSTPQKTRDTKSSSYYGDSNDAAGPSETAAGIEMAPKALTRSPGYGLRKSNGSLWGDPGPAFGDDETISPVDAEIGLAETTEGNAAVARSVSLKRLQPAHVDGDMSWLKIQDA